MNSYYPGRRPPPSPLSRVERILSGDGDVEPQSRIETLLQNYGGGEVVEKIVEVEKLVQDPVLFETYSPYTGGTGSAPQYIRIKRTGKAIFLTNFYILGPVAQYGTRLQKGPALDMSSNIAFNTLIKNSSDNNYYGIYYRVLDVEEGEIYRYRRINKVNEAFTESENVAIGVLYINDFKTIS